MNRTSIFRNKRLFVVVTRHDYPWGENLCEEEEAYALVIGLRDRKNVEARLYSQIRARLSGRLRPRAKV